MAIKKSSGRPTQDTDKGYYIQDITFRAVDADADGPGAGGALVQGLGHMPSFKKEFDNAQVSGERLKSNESICAVLN